jgi:SPP1 gp7 family putative phage head morphogenesis protein
MKSLPAQRLKQRYYTPIEGQLTEMFRAILFAPLVEIITKANEQMSDSAHGMMNAAENPLQSALRNGRVQYEAGVFSGQFSSGISLNLRAIGATFDKHQKVYRLDPAQVPGWVKNEAAAYQATARGTHDALLRRLDEIQTGLDATLDKKEIRAKHTLREIQSDFKTVASAIQIKPELSEEAVSRLADDYSKNLKLYVKDFSRAMITDLRGAVEANAQEGYRFDRLVTSLKSKYGTTQNKAKFLARQETALFMSKYRKERFSEAGVTHYRWSTSHDEKVRPSPGTAGIARANNHRVLDGRVFAYSDPPVVDTANGRRANPGEDFNCRCVDIPILERVMVTA